MRGTVLPGALAIAALTVACGPAREASRASQAADESSVHFRDVTTYVNEGQKTEDVETGAFDWAKHEGWADSGNAHGSSHDLLQVGEDCFARTEEGTWRHWRPEKEENGLCEPDLFQPPGELLRTLRSLGTLDRIGKEKLGGDSSTHYRLTPAENVDIPELWLDVWLDERNLVLRLSQPAGEASPRIRDFFDFGAEVHVTPPCEVMPASRSSAPTQAREKLASCVEDQDWGS